MTITEYSSDLSAENLPSFYRPPERMTSAQVVKGLGHVASALVSVFKPVETFASHGDHTGHLEQDRQSVHVPTDY